MKRTRIKHCLLLVISSGTFFFSQAQWKDSASYKQAVVQYYKQQTTGLKTYRYIPDAYTAQEQDTLFQNALVWKKENVDRPMLLNYYKLEKGTPAANAKLKYLEETASKEEYYVEMKKAADLYASQNMKKAKTHETPGLKTAKSSNTGEFKNNDKEIQKQVLKNWKF